MNGTMLSQIVWAMFLAHKSLQKAAQKLSKKKSKVDCYMDCSSKKTS